MYIAVVTEKRRYAAPFKPYADERRRFAVAEQADDWHAMRHSAEVQQRLYWRFWVRRAQPDQGCAVFFMTNQRRWQMKP